MVTEENVGGNRTRLGRFAERGHYDFETIARIVDEAIICYVGLTVEDQPVVFPTTFGRIGGHLYIHGSVVAQWMRSLAESIPLCVTISLLDELVLARSAFQHSLNYRSVIARGRAERVTDEAEKLAALETIVEQVCPGRWPDVIMPRAGELRSTLVLRLPLEGASAKIRTGPPTDSPDDMGTRIWAGCVPFHTSRGTPVPDPQLKKGVVLPAYLRVDRSGAQRTE